MVLLATIEPRPLGHIEILCLLDLLCVLSIVLIYIVGWGATLGLPFFQARLRFSLRTLFVLVALPCVWLGYQTNWVHQRHEFLSEYRSGSSADQCEVRYLHNPGRLKFPIGLRLLAEKPV